MTEKELYEATKEYALQMVRENPKYVTFPDHFYFVEISAMQFCDFHPEADREIVKLAVWLHDIGHFVLDYTGDYNQAEDHAVVSEEMGRKFLEGKAADSELIDKVMHCVRAHRNRDIVPETIEAKIVAAADSASHLIGDGVYTFVLRRYGKESAIGKLERDYRDMNIIPEATKELHNLYENWKNLLNNYPDWAWPEELAKK